MSLDKIIKAIESHTPKQGFNLVGFDDFEEPGEQIYIIQHLDNPDDAMRALKELETKNPNGKYGILPKVSKS